MPYTQYSNFGDNTPNSYDAFGNPTPVAAQYFTGGQMGFLPQSQYLTPAAYGSFRTLPQMGNMVAPANLGLMQSLAIREGGYPIGGMPLLDTYAMGIDKLKYQEMARRKVADSAKAISGTLADAILSTAVGGVVTALTGGNIFLGGAAASLMPSLTTPMIDRTRTTRAIQNLTMSKIVVGSELDPNMQQGFNYNSARFLDKTVRDMAASDTLFKQEDYRKIMNLGMQSGMFDYSNTASQYATKLKTLVGNFKSMMDLLETVDPTVVMQNMERLQRFGVAPKDMTKYINREQMTARMLGISHSDLINSYGATGALIYSQAGLSPIGGEMVAVNTAARYEMSKRLGLTDPRIDSLLHGTSGFTQTIGQGTANFTQTTVPLLLGALMKPDMSGPDMGKVKAVAEGKYNYFDLTKESMQRTSSLTPLQYMKFRGNQANYMDQIQRELGEEGAPYFTLELIKSYAMGLLPDLYKEDPQEAMIQAIMQRMHIDHQAAEKYLQLYTSSAVKGGYKQIRQSQERRDREQRLSRARQEKSLPAQITRFGKYWEQRLGERTMSFWPGQSDNTVYDVTQDPLSASFTGEGSWGTEGGASPLGIKDEFNRTIANRVLNRVTDRRSPVQGKASSAPSDEMEAQIQEAASQIGVPANLLRGILGAESRFNPNVGPGDRSTKTGEFLAYGMGQHHAEAAIDISQGNFPKLDKLISERTGGKARNYAEYRALLKSGDPSFKRDSLVEIMGTAAYAKKVYKPGIDFNTWANRYNQGPGEPTFNTGYVSTVTTFSNARSKSGAIGQSSVYKKYNMPDSSKSKLFTALKQVSTDTEITYEGVLSAVMGATGLRAEDAAALMQESEFQADYASIVGDALWSKGETSKDVLDALAENASKLNAAAGKTSKGTASDRKISESIQSDIEDLAVGFDRYDKQSIFALSNKKGVGASTVLNILGMSDVLKVKTPDDSSNEIFEEISSRMNLSSAEKAELKSGNYNALVKYGIDKGLTDREMGLMMGSLGKHIGSTLTPGDIRTKYRHGYGSAQYLVNKRTQQGINAQFADIFSRYGFSGSNIEEMLTSPDKLETLIERIERGENASDKNIFKEVQQFTQEKVDARDLGVDTTPTSANELMRSKFGKQIIGMMKESSGVSPASGEDSKEDKQAAAFTIDKKEEKETYQILKDAANTLLEAAKLEKENRKGTEVNSKKTPSILSSATSEMFNSPSPF